jgi:hypothetical protein
MTFGAAASHIMIAMTGTATTPLITALQYRARIGSIGVKFMIMPTIVAMQITSRGLIGWPGKAGRPLSRLSDCVCRRSRKDRHGQQAGADDAKRKYCFGKGPCNQPQGLGGLGGGLDIGDVVGVQRRCRRDHDRKCDEFRKSHSDEGVEMNPVEGSFTLMRCPFEDLSGRNGPSSASWEACQKNR